MIETKSKPSQLKKLALTHEVGEKITELEEGELETFQPEYKPKCSFCIRKEQITGDKGDEKLENIEKRLGDKFSSDENTVDLENPEVVLKAYKSKNKLRISKIIQKIDRGLFEKRKNQERPFSSPISLGPSIARVLVNLSGLKPGEYLLDPFCGTGGILIEAGLCGIGVCGVDVKGEMVKGCKENLEEYGIISHDIKQGEVSESTELFDKNFSAIVTDLPYGQASKKTDSAVEDFLELIEEFEGKTAFMYKEPSLGEYEADFSIYIHKNLTRYIYII
ncbi:MAG: putative DNA modification methylase [Candidatus Nanosalina sp. J07AB43]|nr:MAG: putative DNA modification methylase [Candidatus Nanosalina sp. J07AB43]